MIFVATASITSRPMPNSSVVTREQKPRQKGLGTGPGIKADSEWSDEKFVEQSPASADNAKAHPLLTGLNFITALRVI